MKEPTCALLRSLSSPDPRSNLKTRPGRLPQRYQRDRRAGVRQPRLAPSSIACPRSQVRCRPFDHFCKVLRKNGLIGRSKLLQCPPPPAGHGPALNLGPFLGARLEPFDACEVVGLVLLVMDAFEFERGAPRHDWRSDFLEDEAGLFADFAY